MEASRYMAASLCDQAPNSNLQTHASFGGSLKAAPCQYAQPATVLPQAVLPSEAVPMMRNVRESFSVPVALDNVNGCRVQARSLSPVRGACRAARPELPLPGSDESQKQLGEWAASLQSQPGGPAQPAPCPADSRSPGVRTRGLVSNGSQAPSPGMATPPAGIACTPDSLRARTLSPVRRRDPTDLTPDLPTLSPRPFQARLAAVNERQRETLSSFGAPSPSCVRRVLTDDRDTSGHGSFRLVGKLVKPDLSPDTNVASVGPETPSTVSRCC